MGIEFEWAPHGMVVGDSPTVRFDLTPSTPGLYRIDVYATHTYIGEAGNLARRFSGYRNPGGSPETVVPRTNRRIQRRIMEALAVGRVVPVFICTSAALTVDGEVVPLPLNDKTHRLLVEAAAIILAQRAGYTLENLHRR